MLRQCNIAFNSKLINNLKIFSSQVGLLNGNIYFVNKQAPIFAQSLQKRKFWLSRSMMEEAVDEIEKNPYYKKYEQKINKMIK